MEIQPAPRRRGRPRSFDIEAVAAKAAPLLWEHGYEGVSVDELTTAMGITTQSFYAAFGSKEQLYRSALAWYDREVMRPVREAAAGQSDVVRAVQDALAASAREFTRPDRPAGCMRSTAGLSASRENEAITDLAAGLRRDTIAFFKAALDRGVADGQLRRDLETAAMAGYLNAAVIGMAVSARDGATTAEVLAIGEIAGSVLEGVRRPERATTSRRTG